MQDVLGYGTAQLFHCYVILSVRFSLGKDELTPPFPLMPYSVFPRDVPGVGHAS